jgi:MipA family protein
MYRPMRRLLLLPLITSLLSLPAWAEDPPTEKPTRFEGAIGLLANYGPNYAGADDYGFRLRPAGFVRYGRLTISGAGGFRTRTDNDVDRGVSATLIQRDRLRFSLSGRWTNGRSESDSDRLDGLGDIRGTVLLRATARWSPEGPWSYSLAVSTDALGRGNGTTADIGVARQWRLDPETKLNFSSSLTVADAKHMQAWFGVTPEQADRSGYPVYRPGSSLMDADLGVSLRHEFGPHWGSYVGAGVSVQLGNAASSPLVRQRLGWSVGSGLVWRF